MFTYTPTAADWLRILPELALLGTVMLVLAVDLVAPARQKSWLAYVGLLGVVAAIAVTGGMLAMGDGKSAFFGMLASDGAALVADLLILGAVGVALLFSPAYLARFGVRHLGEYYALLLLSALGMMLMSAGSNLMIVFVGLEMFSLALYVLCAMLPRRARSQEAGMKYFLLSSFASAFLLYGMALTFGSAGTTDLGGIRRFLDMHPFTLSGGYGPLLLAALALMAVGLSFKISAVPFQAWTPDVYVGAPTPVTAFMSVGTKVAAFLAIVRVFVVALHPVLAVWTPVFWAIAVLTMVAGNLFAISQRDVKRMLAYSSIANAGYMLIAIAVPTRDALAALLIYLAAYTAMNLGAFGVVAALERGDGSGTTLDGFAGLSRRRPALAAALAIFLFGLAGVPALAGFIGKWYVFRAAVLGNHTELAIIGALASVAGIFYYFRVIWAMYFTDVEEVMAAARGELTPSQLPSTPAGAHGTVATGTAGSAVAVAEPTTTAQSPARRADSRMSPADEPLRIGVSLGVGLAIALLGTVLLGIIPGLFTQFASSIAGGLLP
jgi:NADH-quinone oxidoreductase subunit N